ncbi:Hsp20/alpha crystallin family protein [Vibrio sp.]|uniref:Hsp20/alpha crystallin family protein n=1 Tax=Vibrio viridaestus TaxID=2487322 RepID=A0A3N9TLD6_9VIBR|nr:Hsp20/alpha crystallin family protein [Vibrio viridaestus]MDC0612397.1 Hsp20/alpha crystallin family protein [Vibrio sp.]RQW64415.1 Hsp20/alpha crystallin family protein [Vibrio viridaestus]
MSILPEDSLSDVYRLFDQACPTHRHNFANDSFLEPRIDVVEKETAYEIIADLPGVARENISVDCNDGVLTIKAKVSRELETQANDKFLHQERVHGDMKRIISLGNNIDTREIYAKYHDGVLAVFVPKQRGHAEEHHHISIN